MTVAIPATTVSGKPSISTTTKGFTFTPTSSDGDTAMPHCDRYLVLNTVLPALPRPSPVRATRRPRLRAGLGALLLKLT